MFASAIDVGAYEAIGDQAYITVAYEIMGPVANGVTGPGPIAAGSTIAFEEVTFDVAQTLPFRIRNVGTQTLVLDLDQMTLPEGVRLTERPFEFIFAGADAVLEFQWDAQSDLAGAISIPTNDPTHVAFVMDLSGTVTTQPDAPTVTAYGLLLDSGASSTDETTYNPRISVQVEGEFLRGATIVEFDHGYTNHATDGLADGHVIVRHSGESESYDPRTFDAAWPTVTSGTESASLRYRLLHVNDFGRTLSTDAWTEFDFTLQPTPTSSAMSVSNLATEQGSIGDWTTPGAVAVTGQVDGSGTRYVQVAVNGQTLPDAIGQIDAQNNFTVELPFGLSYLNASTINVRAYEYSDSDDMNLYGAWTDLAVAAAAPTSVATLSYDDNRLDELGEPLAPALLGSLADAVDSRFAEVEFYYNDSSQDIVVGRTWTELDGSFTCVPSDLPVGVAVTVVARMVVRPEGSDPIFGAGQSVSVTYSPTDLVAVSGVMVQPLSPERMNTRPVGPDGAPHGEKTRSERELQALACQCANR